MRFEALEARRLMASAPLLFEFDSSPSPGASAASVAPYRSGSGFGWSNASGLKVSEGGGSVRGRDGTFLVDLADGAYDLTVTASATDKGGLAIRAEGAQATPTRVKSLGDLVERDFRVDVRGGRLNLQIAPRSAQGADFKLSSLAIRAVTQIDAAPSSPIAPVVTIVAPPPSAGSSAVSAAMPVSAAAPTKGMPSTPIAAGMTTADMDMPGTHPGVGDAFFAAPTVVSNKSGNWSDPSTWSTGRVPAAGDRVWVSANTTVTYNVASDAALDSLSIQPGGKLTFRTDINTRLTVGTLTVLAGATLEVGTTASPVAASVTAEIVIADKAINLATDPDAIGTGLLGWGKVTMRGAAKSNFVDLATVPRAGDTTLTLAQVPAGWKAGDRLILPDSRQPKIAYDDTTSFNSLQWEAGVIRSISGNTITLQAPLRYDHPGARDASGTLRFLPDVVDLTRNVTIRSANPSGTRGHVWMTGRADVDLEYVGLKDLGRSLNSKIVDQTTYDSSGRPVSYATNQIGRYPLHMHHLVGPSMPQANGYQFTLLGNAIDGGDAPNDRKWGIAVHVSNYGLIQDNAVYNMSGAAYVTEEGSEVGNVFQHNIAVRTDGLGDTDYGRISAGRPQVDFGHAGDGFWFQGPSNIVRGNVAADSREAGFNYYTSEFGNQNYHVPTAQGNDPDMAGQYQVLANGQMPFGSFSDNEAYAAVRTGLQVHFRYGVGSEVVLDRMKTWNSMSGFVNESAPTKVTLNNLVMIGDAARSANYDYWNNPSFGVVAQGLAESGAVARDMTVNQADIENVGVAVIAPTLTTYLPNFGMDPMILSGQPYQYGPLVIPPSDLTRIGTFTVANSTFKNNQTDVLVNNTKPSEDGSPNVNHNRRVILDNNSFSHTTTSGYKAIATDLIMTIGGNNSWDYRGRQEVLVYRFDRNASDNFQVFFPQQSPGVVMPQSDYVVAGSPVAGLTNQQNWDAYGIATGGQLTPSDATSRAGIVGSVAPIRTAVVKDSTPPVVSNLVSSAVTSDGKITLTWRTNEPADTQVLYQSYAGGMPSSNYYRAGTRITDFGLDHTLVITGIDPTLAYKFTVVSRDPAGNYSTTSVLSGRIQPPVVTNVNVTSPTLTSAKVTWTTDVASSSTVEYGLTTSYGSAATTDGGVINHTVQFGGLQPFTTYHYRIISQDRNGNRYVGEDRTLQTGSAYWIRSAPGVGYSETGPASSWRTIGSWSPATTMRYYFTWDTSGNSKASATWSFGNLAAGTYQVYTTWTSGTVSDRVPYTIYDGGGAKGTAIVDQHSWPGSFTYNGEALGLIGTYNLSGGPVSVTMAANDPLTGYAAGTMILVRIS